MSGSNLAVVREMWSAFAKRGLSGVVDAAAEDAVWIPYSAGGREFSSSAEYREYVESMSEREEVVEAHAHDFEELGELVLVSGALRVRRAGALMDTHVYWVHRIAGGKVVWTASFPDRAKALAEAEGAGS